MQQYSLMLKDQILKSLSDGQKALLEKKNKNSPSISDEEEDDEDLDSYQGDLLLKQSMKRRKRKGGATANVKRALQKNLNIVSANSFCVIDEDCFFSGFLTCHAMPCFLMCTGLLSCRIGQIPFAIFSSFYFLVTLADEMPCQGQSCYWEHRPASLSKRDP
jgi:hypothetical protein